MTKRLPVAFYRRDALDVARDLLGKRLVHAGVTLEITEVEAYRPGDSAAHTRFGRTQRNAPMWGPPGRAYVYLCYGVHQMLNIVTDADGVGAAVLIRACRPVAGIELIRARRRGLEGPRLLDGPGKVAAALGVDGGLNHHALHTRGGLECRDGPRPERILAGPRVGIAYANAADVRAPWRLATAGTPWVGHRARLRPLRRS